MASVIVDRYMVSPNVFDGTTDGFLVCHKSEALNPAPIKPLVRAEIAVFIGGMAESVFIGVGQA